MQGQKIKEIEQLFLEFFPLYYQKFAPIFREDDGSDTRTTKNQKRAIVLIKQRRGVTSSELGRCLDLRKGSLTALLDSLAELGLVERRPDEKDRRRAELYLTAAGEAYFTRMMQRHETMFIKIFSALTEEDLGRALYGLRDVVGVIKKL